MMKLDRLRVWFAAAAMLVCVVPSTALADTPAIQLSVIGSTQRVGFNQGGAEIVAHDAHTHRLFVVNGLNDQIDVFVLQNGAPVPASFAITALEGGVPNSVAVSRGVVAVAVEDAMKTNPGKVFFFNTDGEFLAKATVGALPDMLTFTSDGRRVLVANEGEPSDYTTGTGDPEGSVSIIDISRRYGRDDDDDDDDARGFWNNWEVRSLRIRSNRTADFRRFNSPTPIDPRIRIFGPNASVAQDIEPEYIALSKDGRTAYVTLQENNALGILDVHRARFTQLIPLGFKDHNNPNNGLDASDRDFPGNNNGLINIRPWPVYGMYQPDAIASFRVRGRTYLITANEGDARTDWPGFNEEASVGSLSLDAAAFAARGYTDVSTGATGLRNADLLGRLNVTNTLGNTDADADFEALYAFGARSFAIWDDRGRLVHDSGDQLEQITAAAYPLNFNSNHEATNFDNRSDNKGPEPEAVTTGKICGRTYAFVGLERIGGIVVFDVTNPQSPAFVQYINNRDFTKASTDPLSGDLGPEGVVFVSRRDSQIDRPMLIVANEVSGTTTTYAIDTPNGCRHNRHDDEDEEN